jgi:2-amino-4-hydroxy-6-hydroxymethyldihydropteridine diphosphokinase
MPELVYLGIGSNIGDRETNIFSAIAALEVRNEITVSRSASIYETDPLYNADQPKFLNTVVELKTDLDPEVLLQVCQGIELMLGRPRDHKKNEPRVIDIDILAYETKMIEMTHLNIPHPEIFARKFVLVPWVELAPEFMVQCFNRTVLKLLELCPDISNVRLHPLEKSA